MGRAAGSAAACGWRGSTSCSRRRGSRPTAASPTPGWAWRASANFIRVYREQESAIEREYPGLASPRCSKDLGWSPKAAKRWYSRDGAEGIAGAGGAHRPADRRASTACWRCSSAEAGRLQAGRQTTSTSRIAPASREYGELAPRASTRRWTRPASPAASSRPGRWVTCSRRSGLPGCPRRADRRPLRTAGRTARPDPGPWPSPVRRARARRGRPGPRTLPAGDTPARRTPWWSVETRSTSPSCTISHASCSDAGF